MHFFPDHPIRLLAVDDDPTIRDLIVSYFSPRSYLVTTAVDGPDGLRQLQSSDYDLLLLDVTMPGMSGLDLCREIRCFSEVPIIMLTAIADEASKVIGLEFGADDYVLKPFSSRELEARIRALLRRAAVADADEPEPEPMSPRYYFDGWALFSEQRTLTNPDGANIELSAPEYHLLNAFVTHPRRVLSRDQLMNYTRGRDSTPYDRSIDITVCRLRKKLGETGHDAHFIKAFRGEGYFFVPAVTGQQK